MTDRPSGFTAVMANRVPTDPESLDYFPTPPWAARAGAELIARLDPGLRSCWEPACGEGHMAHGLLDYFGAGVFSSDIHPYGYGHVIDFLGEGAGQTGSFDWIVTNPPFVKGEAFVRAALPLARRGVAMLLRLAFLEGQTRYRLLFGDSPVTVVAPFAERVPMTKGHWDPKASTATAYAWFVWIKDHPPGPRLEPIAPGARQRLTRDSDQRFAWSAPGRPAFDWGEPGLPHCAPGDE